MTSNYLNIDLVGKPIQERIRVKRGLTIFIKDIITNMMMYVDGNAILKKICENHASDKLGEFRAIFISILDVTTHDLSMLQSCTNIFNQEAHNQQQLLVTRRLRPIPSHQLSFDMGANRSTQQLNNVDIVKQVLEDYVPSQRNSLLTMFDYIVRARNASRDRQIETGQKLAPPLPYSKIEHLKYPRKPAKMISGVSFYKRRNSDVQERKYGTLNEEDEKLMKQLEKAPLSNPFSSLKLKNTPKNIIIVLKNNN